MDDQNKPSSKEKLRAMLITAAMFSVVIIFFGVIMFRGCSDDNAREEKRQVRMEIIKKFDEISVERDAPHKLSVDILLKKELTEIELREIANLIYSNKTGENYQRVFITCYLHGSPWATAHFDPDLEIKIKSF